MLKLFENNFINTMNKLAVSIEDIKLGRFGGEDKGRDGGGGGGGGGGMTRQQAAVTTALPILSLQSRCYSRREH